METIDTILDKSKEACGWLVEYLSSAEGSSYIKYVSLQLSTMNMIGHYNLLLNYIKSNAVHRVNRELETNFHHDYFYSWIADDESVFVK